MSDHTLSSLRRRSRQTGSVEDRAAVLVARLRSAPACEACSGLGRVEAVAVPVLTPRGPLVSTDTAPVMPCPSCAGTGSPLRARVALATYCRDEVSALCDGSSLSLEEVGRVLYGSLADWLVGLSRWSDLHPRAPGWVLVRAAVAAARVAYGEWAPERCDGECGTEDERDCPVTGAALRTIDAAEAWLADPTEERWTAWHVAYVEAGHLAWLPVPTRASETGARARDAILSATFAGEQPVREAICRSLVEWALSEDA